LWENRIELDQIILNSINIAGILFQYAQSGENESEKGNGDVGLWEERRMRCDRYVPWENIWRPSPSSATRTQDPEPKSQDPQLWTHCV